MARSSKQMDIMNFLVQYQEKHGFSPSVREICEAVGLTSTSTVHSHLSKLESEGYIRRVSSKPRAIEILKKPEQASETAVSSYQRTASYSRSNSASYRSPSERVVAFQPNNGPEMTVVPIIGRVRAGEPILAVENIEDYFPLPVDLTRNSDCFMLYVQGESMINAGILENDLILVRMQNTAENGEIVVALLGDSVTVKRFYREPDYIRLQPENDYMSPIRIKDCRILGKVIGLYRNIK